MLQANNDDNGENEVFMLNKHGDEEQKIIKMTFLNYHIPPKLLLVFLSMAYCIQGLVSFGLVTSAISTIERRFGLSSGQSGAIVATQDIGSLLFLIPASHFGGKSGSSKPHWIGGGMLVLGLGSIVWALPHFISNSYLVSHELVDQNSSQLCQNDGRKECELSVRSSISIHWFIFMLGQFLQGAGCAPITALATTLLDESVEKRSSPLYISIFQAWSVIGPALGYLIGGSFLFLHTDLVKDSSVGPSSSMWVGAWWLGFLVAGILALVPAICLLLTKKQDKAEFAEEKDKGFFKDIQSFMKNNLFLLICFAGCGDGAVISGFSSFLPKFVENQYSISRQVSAQIVGLVFVFAGAIGTILSGWLIKKFDLSRTKILLFCLGWQAISLPFMAMFLLTCPSPQVAGPPNIKTENIDCQDTCQCPTFDFDPVCGSDNIFYLSPCHAGCSSFASNFTNCACVDGGTARRSGCSTDCNNITGFSVLLFLGVIMTFITHNPVVVSCMRSVSERQRSIALGVRLFICQICGNIPGPIILGYFIDNSCRIWNQNCGTYIIS